MEKKLNKDIIYYGMLAVFFFIVLFQMKNVFYYHDDYGYLSLSYAGINIPNVQGTSYGIREILQFLYQHYMVWGGRILYFFVEIIIGKNIWGWRIIQTIIITLIIYIMIRKIDKERNIFTTMIIMMLYISLPAVVAVDGLYWFTASVLYLFPMLPFWIGCLLFYKNCFKENISNKEKKLMYISLFLATFSQEQVSCGTVFFITICSFLKWWMEKDKDYKVNKDIVISCLCTYSGFLILILSPGSWKRANSGDMTIFERIVAHSKTIIHYCYLEDGKMFQMIMILVVMLMGIYLYKKKLINIFFAGISTICSLWLLYINIRFLKGTYNGLMITFKYNTEISSVILLFHILLMTSIIFLYCKNIKGDIESLLFLISGMIMMLFMVISPSAVPYRATLPLYIIMIFVISDMANNLYSIEKIKLLNMIWASLFFVLALVNYMTIVEGYEINQIVNKTNDIIFRSTSEQIRRGEDIREITVYKLIDNKYGSTEAYKADYILKYVKKYYGLPEYINIEYVEYK